MWEVYSLAKKMVEEILLAEREAEKIIEEAKSKAEDILKNSQIEAEQKRLQLEEETKKLAEEIILNAKAEATKILEIAEKESVEENKKLEELYVKNKDTTVSCVVDLLAE